MVMAMWCVTFSLVLKYTPTPSCLAMINCQCMEFATIWVILVFNLCSFNFHIFLGVPIKTGCYTILNLSNCEAMLILLACAGVVHF